MRRIVGLGYTQCVMQYTFLCTLKMWVFFKREHLSNIYHYSICTMCYEEQRVNLLLQIEGVANEL